MGCYLGAYLNIFCIQESEDVEMDILHTGK